MLHMRKGEILFDYPTAQLGEVQRGHAVPIVICEAVDGAALWLAQEPLHQ